MILNNHTLLEPISLTRPKESFTAYLAISKQTLPELIAAKQIFLHAREEAYFKTLVAERRQISYLLGRYVAKKAVGKCFHEQNLSKIEISSGIFQQPIVCYTSQENIQVSIAHSQQWGAALAFPEAHPMAIDLETVDPQTDAHLWPQITSQEKRLVENLELTQSKSLILLWTIKEALSKVLKTGLMTDFHVYELSTIRANGGCFESIFKHFTQYRAVSWFFQNFAWSLVLPRNTTFLLRRIIDRQQKIWLRPKDQDDDDSP